MWKENHSDDLPIYLRPILEKAQDTPGSLWHSIMVSIMEIQGEDFEEKVDLATSQYDKNARVSLSNDAHRSDMCKYVKKYYISCGIYKVLILKVEI